MFERLKILIGNKIDLLNNKTVLILGVGGVGSYAVEALARSNIGMIIIVDNDKVDITNINRQLIALNSSIGKYKVDVLEERILDINPNCKVIKIREFITNESVDTLLKYKLDYVIDACDSILTKKELIRKCLIKNIKIISCMGMGNRFDPSKIEIIDISKTSYDPLARIIRKMINEEKIKNKLMVVCSHEKAVKTDTKVIGSTSFVPSVAGLMCASYVVNDIIKE